MSDLPAFSTPARQQDFPRGSPEQAQCDELWNTRVSGFTQQAIVGNPWTSSNQANQASYYDPLVTDVPKGTKSVLVFWTAFPNRLVQYLGVSQVAPFSPYKLSDEALLQIADTGAGFRPIPATHCPQAEWTVPPCKAETCTPYGPYGPRGWLDEYCEWSVTRDSDDKIVRVDFVCENPEYWYTLWQISPQTVAALYEQTLNAGAAPANQITVTVEDLQLVDPATQEPVIDPSTGRPAYNPLNKWNSGTVSVRGDAASASGGAMHLTSTPNTLQTELGLAAGATVLRPGGNSDPQELICCGQYGQSYRNSDPHIGQAVNQAVAGQTNPTVAPANVSLADPVGLYIQMPDFDSYTLPPGAPAHADVSECWQIVRGSEQLEDHVTGHPFPGNFMLHVAFQVPQSWDVSFTVGDIEIGGTPIQWAGQIAQTFDIGLYPRPIPVQQAPATQPCVPSTPPSPGSIQPLQLFYAALWNAYYATPVPNPVDQPMSLASNTVIVPPRVAQGATQQMVLTCAGVGADAPQISFSPGDDVTVTDVSAPTSVTYAVPGNTYPGTYQAVTFEVTVADTAQLGLRSIVAADAAHPPGEPAPAFLEVVAPPAG
jgi:hypothetical protein